GHGSQVLDVAFAPDGGLLAACSADTLLLWETPGGALRNRLRGPPEAFWCLAFRPDGKMLVAGGPATSNSALPGSLRLYPGKDFGDVVISPDLNHGGFTALGFTDGGSALLALASIGTLVRVDLHSFRSTFLLPGGSEAGAALAVAPDGQGFATAAHYGPPPAAGPPRSGGAAPPHTSCPAARAQYRGVRLWEAGASSARSYLHEAGGDVFCLAYAPDGRVLAAGDAKGAVTLWDVAAAPERVVLDAREDGVRRLAFSRD